MMQRVTWLANNEMIPGYGMGEKNKLTPLIPEDMAISYIKQGKAEVTKTTAKTTSKKEGI